MWSWSETQRIWWFPVNVLSLWQDSYRFRTTCFCRLQGTTSMQKEIKLKPLFIKPAVMCWHWAAANHSQMSFGCAAYTKLSFLMHNMDPIIIFLFPLAFIFPQTRAALLLFPPFAIVCTVSIVLTAWRVFLLPFLQHGLQSSTLLGLSFHYSFVNLHAL